MKLLDRLRQGPLRSDDYTEVAGSRKSLRTLIHRLRVAGYDIESIDIAGSSVRRPKVEYRLASAEGEAMQ